MDTKNRFADNLLKIKQKTGAKSVRIQYEDDWMAEGQVHVTIRITWESVESLSQRATSQFIRQVENGGNAEKLAGLIIEGALHYLMTEQLPRPLR